MSSDQRWTGGIANREWQRGTRAEPDTDLDAVTAAVRRYLDDCERFRAMLNPAHHPTAHGALKVVFWQGDGQKRAVAEAFRRLTGGAAA